MADLSGLWPWKNFEATYMKSDDRQNINQFL
jgi:hypothetical protein